MATRAPICNMNAFVRAYPTLVENVAALCLGASETWQQVVAGFSTMVHACQALSGIAAVVIVCFVVVACHWILLDNRWGCEPAVKPAQPRSMDLTRHYVNGMLVLQYQLDDMARNRVMRMMQDWEPRVTYHEHGPAELCARFTAGQPQTEPAFCIHHDMRKVDEYERSVQVWICSHDECVRFVPQGPIQTQVAYPAYDCVAPSLPRFSRDDNPPSLAHVQKIWIVVTPGVIPSNLHPLRHGDEVLGLSHMVGHVPHLRHDIRLHSWAYLNAYDNEICRTRVCIPAAAFARAHRDARETLSTHLHAALYGVMDSDIVRFIVLPFLISPLAS